MQSVCQHIDQLIMFAIAVHCHSDRHDNPQKSPRGSETLEPPDSTGNEVNEKEKGKNKGVLSFDAVARVIMIYTLH